MLAVCVTFTFADAPAFETFLPLVLTQARNSLSHEPECHLFEVCTDAETLSVFLYELYTDQAAFDAHMAAEYFAEFDAATAGLFTEKRVQLMQRHEA